MTIFALEARGPADMELGRDRPSDLMQNAPPRALWLVGSASRRRASSVRTCHGTNDCRLGSESGLMPSKTVLAAKYKATSSHEHGSASRPHARSTTELRKLRSGGGLGGGQHADARQWHDPRAPSR
jgi:hypothetical protein